MRKRVECREGNVAEEDDSIGRVNAVKYCYVSGWLVRKQQTSTSYFIYDSVEWTEGSAQWELEIQYARCTGLPREPRSVIG